MKKVVITLSDDDFSKLEEIRLDKYSQRSKSNEIAWLISQERERLQEDKRKKTPAEIVQGIKAYVSRLEKKPLIMLRHAMTQRLFSFR
jgi:hypothetical protein